MVKFIALIGMVVLLAGCQRAQSTEGLPSPSFLRQVLRVPEKVSPQQPATSTQPATRPISPTSKPVVAANPPAGWVPRVPARPWKWIVIHHSSTAVGGAKSFDRTHREKGWDELGYHFVIGNGSDTGNGQIEVGPRWIKQKYGAHASTPDHQYNDNGIGICLVGDFEVTRPSQQQMESLARLVSFLQKRYNIPPSRVIGHKDVKATDCPGRNLNLNVVRRMSSQVKADSEVRFIQSDVAMMIDRGDFTTGNDDSEVAISAEALWQQLLDTVTKPVDAELLKNPC